MAPNDNNMYVSNQKDNRRKDRIVYGTTYRHREVDVKAMSAKTLRLINDAKIKHRSDLRLERWTKDGFAGSDICEAVIHSAADVKREHSRELTYERFAEEYEIPELPVVIDGIPEEQSWAAVENWKIKNLKRRYRGAMLKCGEDDNGKVVRVKLKYFLKYMKNQVDDSPLYIFDSSFDDRKDTTPILKDYNIPKYFPDDLFELVGESKRPPYRWFLVGPKRSGTCVHIDPLGTSAWNALIIGRKRWVLFPPNTPKRVVKGKDYIYPDEDDEAINYFADILPRIKAANPDLEITEFIQYPGETVYVPGGWWHAVMNLDDTIAITQNFCSRNNFATVWKKTRSGRKRMAVKWLQKLEEQYPHLASLAKSLNEEDGYVMYQSKNKKHPALESSDEDASSSMRASKRPRSK